MRRLVVVVAVLVAAVPALALAQGSSTLNARLNGRSEVPRTPSTATGTATFTIAPNGRSIRYRLNATGLSGPPQMAHVHLGPRGRAGGVLITISPKQFTLPRSGTLTAKQFSAVGNVRTFAQAVRAMRAGRTYVNIHTKMFPAGEIRGQVRVRG